MRGERPPQSHLAKYWDESQEVGRTDVTDVIEDAIEKINMSMRSYPDLFSHHVTKALIDAGVLAPEGLREERHRVTYQVGGGAGNEAVTHHYTTTRYVTDRVLIEDTERGVLLDADTGDRQS